MRESVMARCRDIANRLRPLSAILNREMPPSVRMIAAGVNTAYMAAVVDALQWLDKSIVCSFIHGFKVVGDIPDSGVYRPIDVVSDQVFWPLYNSFISTAHQWNRILHNRLKGRASGSAEARESDVAVSDKSQKESTKGLIIGPYDSPRALAQAIAAVTPAHLLPFQVRILNRFGIVQKDSVRAIDDGRSNGANSATRMRETVTTPHFVFPAIVARAVAVAAASRGLTMPAMLLALADLSAAYRTVPSAQPWFTAVGFFDQRAVPPRPRYYFLPGHNFGLISAVVNFNRFPELIVVAARVLAAVPADHYYDDFLVPDLAVGGESGLRVIESFVLDMGIGRARRRHELISSPELDPDKRQASAPTNTVLGVGADLSKVHTTGVLEFFATPERVLRVLALFNEAFARGHMSPHLASSLRGKLFFLLSAAYGMAGRAATLPLVQRQYRDTDHRFVAGSELHHSLLFFRALLPNLPRLRLQVTTVSDPPLLVYTDASFWVATKRRREGDGECADTHRDLRGALGAVVFDPRDRSYYTASAAPPWALLLASWRLDRKTYIAELEALAALSVYSTYPKLFAGRRVQHFVDNSVALSAYVHGYSGKQELAKTVNVFYLQMVALRASVYFDYVPSKANIADLPSRGEHERTRRELSGLRRRGSAPDVLIVPSIAQWTAPLDSWVVRSEYQHLMFAA
jgi:hypothetical protein